MKRLKKAPYKACLLPLMILILTALSLSVSAAGGEWSFKRPITIDRTKVAGSLSDFPVLIDATIGSGKAKPDASDVYFTSSDGISKLSHEIESYDSSSGRVVAWVNVPVLNNVTDTLLYMYYGNSNADDQQNAAGVWDSNYLSVHHLEEKSGTSVLDSTGKNNGVANNVTLNAAGKIDGANQFNGVNSRIILPQIFTTQNQFTIEAWINTENKWGYVVSQRDWSNRGVFLQHYGGGSYSLYVNEKSLWRSSSINSWHYVVGTYDGATAKLYLDAGTPATTPATLTWPSLQLIIGDRNTFNRQFKGYLDEIRISDVPRSDSYIKTSYNNQNNPTAFIIVGDEETLSLSPIVSNEKPQNEKIDVYTNLTEINFDLFHPQGKLMNYTVETSPDIGSRSQYGIGDGTYSVFVSDLQPGVTYTWNLNLTDGVELISKTFTFTTIAPPSQISISDASPNDEAATYNPRLSIKVDDPANNDLAVVFETNATGSWETIGTQTGKSGVYYQRTDGLDVKNTKYYWRVNVFDGSTWTTSPEYSFTAQAFILKWSYNMDVVETYIGPLSVDANNDGIYEVFATGQGKVVGLNGLTGERLWEYTNAEITLHSPFDIHDLNNDGIPELVVASSHRTIALHTNNGSEYWNAPVESGDHHLIILDTDGTKYPYVYVTSADIAHLYNGSGRLRKLRGTDGAIMAEAFSWKPCWGGLSAADANNDGKFEIYANDRSAGYSPPNLAKGLQAYDADTLELLWYHNEPLASSHVMSIIDVNGDGTLDAIGLNQASNGGVCVIDGATGMKMPGKCSMSLNVSLGSHSPFPVYDIDNDGNLEIISARETIAVVWDIGAWKMDGILNRFIEPPRIEDVIGDGKFEIVGAVGDVWIYNSSYSLIEKISGADFIASTIVQDIDNDDQNELIGISSTGVVKVYETSAYAPTPRVRTNNLYYSERHLGVGMYVPPPGAPQPIIKEAYPADTAINVDFNPKLSARVVDFRYDKMDIEISTNASGSWETVATFSDVENGWYNFTPTNMNEGDTNYYWRVTAVDPHADNLVTTQTFSFTTKPKASQMPGWDYKKRITIDHTKVTSNLTNFPVLIEFTDADVAGNAQSGGEDILFTGSDGSTKLAHEIESYDSGSGHLVAWVNVPSLSSTTDTVLYMYYGNPTAEDQQNAGSVWDGNYLGVYHLKEKAGSVIGDSTNKYDGIPTNVTLDAAGKIDGADQFNGIRNTGTNLSKVFTNQNRFTVEGWIYVTNGAKQGYMASQRDWSQRGMLIQYSPSGTLQLYVDGRITPSKPLGGTYSWHYVVGTYDGITARLYRDDTTVASASASTITWPNVSTYIGNRGDTLDRTFAGMIDEVRISNIARSEAYIMTSYSNQNDPASFITVGAAETAADSTKPAVLNAFPAHLSKDVPFDIAEISFDLYDAQSDLMDYTITSYPDIGLDVVQQVSNGRYALSVAGLEPDTEYSWTVDVTDGAETNHKEFTFRTIKGYVLNLSASGSGAIVMSNPGAPYYAAGSEIELTAVPAPGWVFAGWNGVVSWTEAILGNDNPKKINMESNASVTAIFRPVGVPLLADSTFDASIDSVDLRANSLAQDWWESRGNASNGDSTLVTLDTANVGGNTGKKAKLAESTTKNAYLTQEFLVPQTSRFSLEWNVYVDTILPYPDTDRAAQQIIGYDSGSSSGPNAGKRFVMMAFYRPGGSTAQNATMSLIAQELGDTSSSGDWRVIASDLFMDRWYKIRVDVDLPGEKYDVYVNDVLRANDVQASSWLLNLTHISFATWNDGRGTFYVDNVNEYTIP